MRLDVPMRPEGRSSEGGSIRASLSHVVSGSSMGGANSLEVSPQLARQLYEALATCTMQFRGYIHTVRENQVQYLDTPLSAEGRRLYSTLAPTGLDKSLPLQTGKYCTA